MSAKWTAADFDAQVAKVGARHGVAVVNRRVESPVVIPAPAAKVRAKPPRGSTLIEPEVLRPLITVRVPLKLGRGGNSRENEFVRSKRVATERSSVALMLLTAPKEPQAWLAEGGKLTVRITRIAPTKLDRFENLPMSEKSVADAVALWLGYDDRRPEVEYEARQRSEGARVFGVQLDFMQRFQ